jgi:hypothetical protein
METLKGLNKVQNSKESKNVQLENEVFPHAIYVWLACLLQKKVRMSFFI